LTLKNSCEQELWKYSHSGNTTQSADVTSVKKVERYGSTYSNSTRRNANTQRRVTNPPFGRQFESKISGIGSRRKSPLNLINISKVQSLFRDAFANQASAMSNTSRIDTKLLSSNLEQTLNAVMEREVKSIAPGISKMIADALSSNLNKEVSFQSRK